MRSYGPWWPWRSSVSCTVLLVKQGLVERRKHDCLPVLFRVDPRFVSEQIHTDLKILNF